MRFKADRKGFAKSLENLVALVPKKSIKPILEGVLIEKHPDKEAIVMTTSDMELRIEVVFDQITELEGGSEFLVDAKTLYDLVKNSIKDEVEIEIDDKGAVVKSGRSRLKVPVMQSLYYPKEQAVSDYKELRIPKQLLLEGLSRTMFAASDDELVRNLNGVFIEILPKEIRFVSSDSFRLSLFISEFQRENDDQFQAFINLKGLRMLTKLVKSCEHEEIVLKVGTSDLKLELDNTVYSMGLMNVTFPNYRGILPENFECNATVEKESLLKAAKLMSVIAKGKGDTVTVKVEDGKMEILSKSQDRGEGNVEVVVESADGNILAAFDPAYIVEALSHIKSDTAKLEFVDANNALRITGETAGHIQIIMPVKIRT